MFQSITGKSKKKKAQEEFERQAREMRERQEKIMREVEERERREEQKERERERLEREVAELEKENQMRLVERQELEEEFMRRKGAIMNNTEMTSEKVDFSMGTMGLVDRLEAHPAGKLLKNVVISNEPPPDRELNIQRLRRYKPQNDFAKMTLSDVPLIELNSEFLEFPITDAMTSDQFSKLKNFVLVSDVFFHFIPMDSFFSVSSPVMFQINDFRKVDNTRMRDYPLTHSGGYNILMSLDYCVAKKDMHHLSLSVSTSLNSFRKGTIWGAIKVILTLSHMDFPVKSNIQETMGVLHLADSDLQEYISDPRSSDGVITPQALMLLRQHYKRGEIENINAPRDDKKEVNVAATVVGEDIGSVNARDLLSGMRQNYLEKERERVQIQNAPAPHAPLKSALSKGKRAMQQRGSDSSEEGTPSGAQHPSRRRARYPPPPSVSDDGLSNLPDIPVGMDPMESDDDGTIDLPRRPDTPKGRMSAVNFA